ncbi:MAG: 3-keto-disaccharide hydrolase, partial [Gemmataceae bacterium]
KSFKGGYVLRYDWRFPEGSKPDSNSGCLVHIQTPHKVMPKCVEPQGRYRDHGKLFFLGVKGEGKFDEKAHKKALKPMGEWSTTEVTCAADGSVSVKLNGVPVASGKTDLKSGPVGFQSEGTEVHFRNIHLKETK